MLIDARRAFRILIFVCALLSSLPAHALDACFADSAGQWTGPIYEGSVDQLDTDFMLNADGILSGSYQVRSTAPYSGTLTGFRQTGPCEADFVWHDRYGSGFVAINFLPDQGEFVGAWGAPDPVPLYVFDGFRMASQPLS